MNSNELRELLEQLELTQARCALVVGTTDRTVRRWVSGKSTIDETAARLLRVLAALPVRQRERFISAWLRG